ncbi:hypothetical protein TST_0584 [Thermosulfidibacter takaii ABI70S6]|uniref:Uncharacterized protein n=1 Tax=Thermosulfidibacter takaii (strain DSM 17441 / JCM 13301 / NBRC 103674 / ABI70S6) TaxID=1298851 RepID=A0A0S3QST5_THET7|nr:hypothetical protein [Thermosulfidibacter takaii]BAT71390.1 hypothetical protein TST_0584 [Thermosulfidibacter takaii ABI70S6]
MSEIERVLESVRRFLERDDLEVDYREEKEYGFKKSEAPSVVSRIKEAKSPDGSVLRVSITETFYDDAAVSFQEILVELYQNWMDPSRLVAYMQTGEQGTPIFSNQYLFNRINEIYDIM